MFLKLVLIVGLVICFLLWRRSQRLNKVLLSGDLTAEQKSELLRQSKQARTFIDVAVFGLLILMFVFLIVATFDL